MTEETAIVIKPEPEIKLGSLAVDRPENMISRASSIATQLAKVVKDRKLSRNISGREYVFVDGWTALGSLIGVLPREVETVEHENGDFASTVELIRVIDGAVVGRGSAIVGADEPTWAKRPRYARRSMAVTRATGKAYRLGFSWIMSLAGYATTPAEEMDGVIEGEIHDAPAMTAEAASHLKTPKGAELGSLTTDQLKQFRASIDTVRNEGKPLNTETLKAYDGAALLISSREAQPT